MLYRDKTVATTVLSNDLYYNFKVNYTGNYHYFIPLDIRVYGLINIIINNEIIYLPRRDIIILCKIKC